MATGTVPAPAKTDTNSDDAVLNLCKYLSDKGIVSIEKLPERFRGAEVLSKALSLGFIEVGQRQYAIVNKKVEVRDELIDADDKRSGYRQVIDKFPEAHVSDEWTWTDLKAPKRKQLWEVLEEQPSLPEQCRLHVRLTSGGMGMAV